MVPEYDVEILLRDEVYQTDRYSRRDSAGLGFGATDNFSLWIQLDYLTQRPLKRPNRISATCFSRGNSISAITSDDQIHLGFLMALRFPLAKNAYVEHAVAQPRAREV